MNGGLFLTFTVKCTTHKCDASMQFEVDWSEVTLDLNSKRINFPLPWDSGWRHETEYGFRGGDDHEHYYCPRCVEERS